MIKRPINERFVDEVITGQKTTTIRSNPWPVGKSVMLYCWKGAPYRSKQQDVAEVVVQSVRPVKITHRQDGDMIYAYAQPGAKLLHQTEGFISRTDMDEWFRQVVPIGHTMEKALIQFSLKTPTCPLSHLPTF